MLVSTQEKRLDAAEVVHETKSVAVSRGREGESVGSGDLGCIQRVAKAGEVCYTARATAKLVTLH